MFFSVTTESGPGSRGLEKERRGGADLIVKEEELEELEAPEWSFGTDASVPADRLEEEGVSEAEHSEVSNSEEVLKNGEANGDTSKSEDEKDLIKAGSEEEEESASLREPVGADERREEGGRERLSEDCQEEGRDNGGREEQREEGGREEERRERLSGLSLALGEKKNHLPRGVMQGAVPSPRCSAVK